MRYFPKILIILIFISCLTSVYIFAEDKIYFEDLEDNERQKFSDRVKEINLETQRLYNEYVNVYYTNAFRFMFNIGLNIDYSRVYNLNSSSNAISLFPAFLSFRIMPGTVGFGGKFNIAYPGDFDVEAYVSISFLSRIDRKDINKILGYSGRKKIYYKTYDYYFSEMILNIGAKQPIYYTSTDTSTNVNPYRMLTFFADFYFLSHEGNLSDLKYLYVRYLIGLLTTQGFEINGGLWIFTAGAGYFNNQIYFKAGIAFPFGSQPTRSDNLLTFFKTMLD